MVVTSKALAAGWINVRPD